MFRFPPPPQRQRGFIDTVDRDAMRRDARDEFIHTMCDAWKGDVSDCEVARIHDTGDPVRDAYLGSVVDLTTAWSRGGGRR
jgi:hypothetical protein